MPTGVLEIADARTQADFAEARSLFEEYAAAVDLEVCFQNFSTELDGLRDIYGPPGGFLLIARAKGATVGSVGLRRFGSDACEMKRLWVRPSARENDVGRRLATAVVEKARAMGYRRMLLDTHASMHAARNLYLSLGFREIAPYYPRPLDEITCYELLLEGPLRSTT